MKQFWLDSCLELSGKKADFYSGARKIIRRVTLTYKSEVFKVHKSSLAKNIDTDLQIGDCGFTKSKLTMLRKNYFVAESIDAAKKLWDMRVAKNKYGSVGFTCFGHYVKGTFEQKRSKRSSIFGPCILDVVLTYVRKGETRVDIHYRTTELFKKFPADLVFIRDELLSCFNFKSAPVRDIAFHFANVTIHPMYCVTILPHLDDPVRFFEILKTRDKFFHDWTTKWSARYLCEEYSRGIQKFSQALRVRKDAMERLDKKELKRLQQYLRKNHPGHRNDYNQEEDEE